MSNSDARSREIADYRKARLAQQLALKEKKEEALYGNAKKRKKQWVIDEDSEDDFKMFPDDGQTQKESPTKNMKL